MKVNTEIFKAYDIRGKVGTELTPEVVQSIGKAFANWLPKKGVIAVGRDMRPDSEELAQAFIEGLRQQGRDVWDIGQVTSDMIYFAVGKFNVAGGAVITASHNPGKDNGIKLCREEAKPVGVESGLLEIRDLATDNRLPAAAHEGSLQQKEVTEDWITHVLSFVEDTKLKPLRIVVDAGNGMAGKIFPELEPYVPFEVHEMYFELDGSFPNHIANPIEPKNLEALIAEVQAVKADAGVAFDGDGDRAVLVDEKGQTISGTVMTAILATHFLRKNPGATILHNAICGRAVPETIKACGGTPIRTRVGHSYIKSDMRIHNAVFAGEHSGHYYFRDNYMADSGLIAVIVALAVLSDSGQPLSKLADKYRTYRQIPETNFEVTDKAGAIQKVAKAFTEGESDWLDGLTINFKDSWFNIRPSNTEPLLRLNAEAKTQEELDTLVAKVTNLIKR